MTDNQTTGPAPIEDAVSYVRWLRARGQQQADFDRKMGCPKDEGRYRDKARDWHSGYDGVAR